VFTGVSGSNLAPDVSTSAFPLGRASTRKADKPATQVSAPATITPSTRRRSSLADITPANISEVINSGWTTRSGANASAIRSIRMWTCSSNESGTPIGADAPNVVGLVYVAAFGLDEGESLGALLSQGPVTPALAHLFTDSRGFGWLSEDDFVNHFAGDVDPVKARVMYAVQQPLAATAFNDVMSVPAWKGLPSWYLVATDDQALPPAAQRLFAKRMGATVIEVPSSHVAMVSHPRDVASLAETAAEAASVTVVSR